MQVAHPLVAAGVKDHSDFRRDPFGRLGRTLSTTLGSSLGRPHRRARAFAGSTGATFRSSLRLYELVRGRLSDAERETYWAEARFFAGELGATREALPATYDALIAYERYMLATDVIPDADAVAVARDVLRPLPWIPGPIAWLVDAFTAGLLPPSIRLALGLPWRTRERLWFRFVICALRLGVPIVPSLLRVVPQARRYEARIR